MTIKLQDVRCLESAILDFNVFKTSQKNSKIDFKNYEDI